MPTLQLERDGFGNLHTQENSEQLAIFLAYLRKREWIDMGKEEHRKAVEEVFGARVIELSQNPATIAKVEKAVREGLAQQPPSL